MADSEFRPTSLVSASTSILSPLSDALINIDHAVDNDISPADFFSQNRDELCPCIFHIYFKTCENVDCRFSHSSKAIASRPASPSSGKYAWHKLPFMDDNAEFTLWDIQT